MTGRHQDDPAPPPKKSYFEGEDDPTEYEVEPVDEHVVAQERARALSELEQARNAIDVDAIYREIDNRDDFELPLDRFRPQWNLMTLLGVTTALAVMLGVWQGGLLTGEFFAAMIVISLVGLGGLHAWLNHRDAQRVERAIALRKQGKNRSQPHKNERGAPSEEEAEGPSRSDRLAAGLRYSTRDLLVASLAAAVILALAASLGGVGPAAALMGALAVVGLAMQAAAFEPPRFLVLAWWFALAGFCVLTLVQLVATGLGIG